MQKKELGITAEKNLLPMRTGDVVETYADISDLSRDTGYSTETRLPIGISKFIEWYREFYKI